MAITDKAFDELRLADQGQAVSSTSMSPGFFAGVVGLLDLASIAVSGLLAHLVYLNDRHNGWSPYLAAIGLFVVLAVLALNAGGHYRFNAIVAPSKRVLRIIATLAGVFLMLASTAFALKVSEEYSRGWAFLWLGSS